MIDNDDVTRITLERGQKMVAVEAVGASLPYVEFMELIEMIMTNGGYSLHETESYVLEWAADIKESRSN